MVTPANLRPQWIRELSERFQLDFVQLEAPQLRCVADARTRGISTIASW